MRALLILFIPFLLIAASFGQSGCSQPVTPGVKAAPLSPDRKKAAEAGDAQAEFDLALAYEFGCGVPANILTAATWMRRAAEAGHAQAQNDLGVMYHMGKGVPRDFEQAVNWYRRAAKQGEGSAAFNMGAAYFSGDGVPENPISAYAWMVAAKDAGSNLAPDALSHLELQSSDIPSAELEVAELYFVGDQWPKNVEKGVEWLKRAADHGSGVAQMRLGFAYLNGLGVPQDDAEAMSRFHKAEAELLPGDKLSRGVGSEQVWFWLAYMKEKGRGTAPDLRGAVKLYEKSAEAGFAPAMLKLSAIYASGAQGKPDLTRAYMWLIIADGLHSPDANVELAKLTPQLQPKEIEKAESGAQKWVWEHWRKKLVVPKKTS